MADEHPEPGVTEGDPEHGVTDDRPEHRAPDEAPGDRAPEAAGAPADAEAGAGPADPPAREGGPVPPDPADYRVGTDCTHGEFLAAIRVYARAVVDAHGLVAPVSDLEWTVSTRAKRRAGVTKHRDGEAREVALTWAHFQERGWAATAETVRHELIHVHQLEAGHPPHHDERFRAWADALDTAVHCERFAEPAYWVTCADCETRLARYRRSKLVDRPERYECANCGGDLVVETVE